MIPLMLPPEFRRKFFCGELKGKFENPQPFYLGVEAGAVRFFGRV